jgi:3-mercaptopyruvate sulfurtransferase SseA
VGSIGRPDLLEGKMTAATLASIMDYPVPRKADAFTVDYLTVLEHSQRRSAIILDVRPADFFSGVKSDEARAGHIPGAVNRPFSADLAATNGITSFKPVAELEEAYARLIPSNGSSSGRLVIRH